MNKISKGKQQDLRGYQSVLMTPYFNDITKPSATRNNTKTKLKIIQDYEEGNNMYS
jgi:hypothetical protein